MSSNSGSIHHPTKKHAWVPLKQQVDDDEHDTEDALHVVEEYDDDREEVHHDLTPSATTVHHHHHHRHREDSEESVDHDDEHLHDNDDNFLRHPISILRRRSFQSDDDGEHSLERKEDRGSNGRIASLVSSSFELDDEDDEEDEEELNLRRYHHFQIDQSSTATGNNKGNWKGGVIATNNNNNTSNGSIPAVVSTDVTKKWLRLGNYKGQRLEAWWNVAWQTWIQVRQEDRRRRTERLLASPEWNLWDRFQFAIQTWCCDTTNRSMGLVVIFVLFWSLAVWSVSDHDRPHSPDNYHRHHVISSDSKIVLRRWLLGLGIPLLVIRLFWRPLYWYLRGRHVAAQRRARMEWYDHINQGIASSNATGRYIPKTSDHVTEDDIILKVDASEQHERYQDCIHNEDHENESPTKTLSVV